MTGLRIIDRSGAAWPITGHRCLVCRMPRDPAVALAPGDTPAIAARLVPANVPTDDGVTSVGRVEWLGETDAQASDHLGRRGDDPDDRTERDEAVEWLLDYLDRNDGQVGAGDAIKAARRDGIGERTLQRARQRAEVRSVKSGMGAGWVWQLSSEGDTKKAKASRACAPVAFAPSVSPSAESEQEVLVATPVLADCGHPASIRALNGKCALCLADAANLRLRESTGDDCPNCGTEVWPDGLCVVCESGGPDAA